MISGPLLIEIESNQIPFDPTALVETLLQSKTDVAIAIFTVPISNSPD
jgi:hypothetical protein